VRWGQREPADFAILRLVGSLVRVITVVDGVVTRMAFGGGTSDGSDYLFAVGPDVALRWLGILGPGYLEDDRSHSLAPYDGYLIDADRKLLLFYAGLGQFPIGSRYSLRAAMLDAYPRTWAGWTVSWAYHGWDDLTSALGWPSLPRENPQAASLHPYGRDDADPIAYVVTAGDRAYAFDYNASQPWRLGASLLDELPSSRTFSAEEAMPVAGLHLDIPAKRAGVWCIEALDGLESWWPSLWPGWELSLWDDDAGHQPVHFPALDLDRWLYVLAERVHRHWAVRETLLARGVDPDMPVADIGFIQSHLATGFTSQDRDAVLDAILPGSAATINNADAARFR